MIISVCKSTFRYDRISPPRNQKPGLKSNNFPSIIFTIENDDEDCLLIRSIKIEINDNTSPLIYLKKPHPIEPGDIFKRNITIEKILYDFNNINHTDYSSLEDACIIVEDTDGNVEEIQIE